MNMRIIEFVQDGYTVNKKDIPGIVMSMAIITIVVSIAVRFIEW